jgi:hydroxylysine kinase
LESAPPAFGEQAARHALREGFGVESLSLKPLAGERDQNFRVDTAAGQRFSFKISNPADDGAILEMQAAALRHIERVDPGLPVMRALPTATGQVQVELVLDRFEARVAPALPGLRAQVIHGDMSLDNVLFSGQPF